MTKTLLGLLLGLLLAAPTAWSVLRRDTLQATPHGYKLPSLVVTGTSEFDGAVTLPTGDVTGTEILDGTVTAADIATDGVDSAEIAANAVGASEIASNAVLGAEIGSISVAVPFCGQNVNNTTVYVGPALDNLFGQRAAIPGDTYCDTLDSTTETTADFPLDANWPAFKVLGMTCWVTSDPTADVVFTARSAAADLTPSVTCTVAGTGSSQRCVSTTKTTTDIAAGAAVAIKVVTTEDLSLQDVGCKLYIANAS